jgi:hypothetical protein
VHPFLILFASAFDIVDKRHAAKVVSKSMQNTKEVISNQLGILFNQFKNAIASLSSKATK